MVFLSVSFRNQKVAILETNFLKFEEVVPKFTSMIQKIDEKLIQQTKEFEKSIVNEFWADCVTMSSQTQKVNWELGKEPAKYVDSTNSFQITDQDGDTLITKVVVSSTKSADYNLLEYSEFDLHKPNVCMLACRNC